MIYTEAVMIGCSTKTGLLSFFVFVAIGCGHPSGKSNTTRAHIPDDTVTIHGHVYRPPFSFADTILWTRQRAIGFALLDRDGRLLSFCATRRSTKDPWDTFFSGSSHPEDAHAVLVTDLDDIQTLLSALKSAMDQSAHTRLPGDHHNDTLARKFLQNIAPKIP